MTLQSPYDLEPVNVGRVGYNLNFHPHLQFPDFIVARMSHEGTAISVDLDKEQAEELKDWLQDWLSA